jgi:hypothetical protein
VHGSHMGGTPGEGKKGGAVEQAFSAVAVCFATTQLICAGRRPVAETLRGIVNGTQHGSCCRAGEPQAPASGGRYPAAPNHTPFPPAFPATATLIRPQ